MLQNPNTENVPLEGRYNSENIVGDDVDEFSYERVPVSSFGMSMLESMGFYEGRGLGKNPENALHHPIEFIPRHHRQGLGADPKPIFLQKNKNKENSQMVGGLNENGKVRNYINIGEKLVEKKRKTFERNIDVIIIKGKHKDLKGKILNVNAEEKECIVELEVNEESVKVKFEEMSILDEGSTSKKTTKDIPKILHKTISKEGKPETSLNQKKLSWVIPNIRVRIVSKKTHNGKYYNKKVVITDIIDSFTFSALTNEGESLNFLREKDIETLLPPLEKQIIVVKGKNKGKVGILKLRDKAKNKIILQYLDNMEYDEMTQDDVCEFINC